MQPLQFAVDDAEAVEEESLKYWVWHCSTLLATVNPRHSGMCQMSLSCYAVSHQDAVDIMFPAGTLLGWSFVEGDNVANPGAICPRHTQKDLHTEYREVWWK